MNSLIGRYNRAGGDCCEDCCRDYCGDIEVILGQLGWIGCYEVVGFGGVSGGVSDGCVELEGVDCGWVG